MFKSLILYHLLAIYTLASASTVTKSEMKNMQHPRRKSDLFLQDSAVGGADGVLTPEEEIPERLDLLNDHREPLPMDPVFRSLVLGGNYPQESLEDVKPDKVENELEKHKVGGRMLFNLLDPIKDVLFPQTNNSGSKPVVGGGGPVDYIQQVLECKKKLVLCSVGTVFNVKCYLDCILKAHPLGGIVVGAVESVLKALCEPLGTIFDWGLKLFMQHCPTIKTLNHYLALFNIAPGSYKRFSRTSINSLPTIILKYTNGSEALSMKSTINGLETAVKVSNLGVQKVPFFTNRGCAVMNSIDAVQQIVNAFFKNKILIDIILSGYWTVVKMFNLLRITLLGPLQAFLGGFNILTGTLCGLVNFAETGEQSTCTNNVWWKPDIIVPPITGIPFVCGSIPFFSVKVYDEIYPRLYFSEASSTTAAPVISTEAGSNTGRMSTDLSWLDEVLKTFDQDN